MRPDRASLSAGDAAPEPVAPAFRILRSYLRLPPEPGGMEAHIARLTAAQRSLGVGVVHLHNSGRAEGEHVRLLPRWNLGRIRRASLRSSLFYVAALAKPLRLSGDDPLVLHVHGDIWDFLLGRILARRVGARVLAASLHDRISPRKGRLYRAALQGYDLVFTTGKHEQEFLGELLGREVHHLPSAPLQSFFDVRPSPQPECDVIGVANLLPKKRPDLFLDCAARRPDLRFALFGDGPLRRELEDRIRSDRLGNVALPGRRDPAGIADALSRARAFLSTADREGTPTAALEAMAVGLPVILTPSNRYGWLVEPGVNGFVTECRDPEEIIRRIDDVLSDEARRRAMGEANRERARRHSWDASAVRVSALMAEALARKGVR